MTGAPSSLDSSTIPPLHEKAFAFSAHIRKPRVRPCCDGFSALIHTRLSGTVILLWLPVAPVVLATSIDALIPGWDDPRERAWLGVSAAGAAFGGLVTADVVRGINHELLFAAQPPENRGNLSVLRTHRVCWVAGNYFRVALHLDRHSVIKSCHMQKECRDLF